MEHKSLYFVLLLANGKKSKCKLFKCFQCLCNSEVQAWRSLPFDRIEHLTVSPKGRPPFWNNNDDDKILAKTRENELESLISDTELRNFPKAPSPFRRSNNEARGANFQRSHEGASDCNGKTQNMRRTDTQFLVDIDDVNLGKNIEKLIQMTILHKYKQAINGVLNESINNDDSKLNDFDSDDRTFESEESDSDEFDRN